MNTNASARLLGFPSGFTPQAIIQLLKRSSASSMR